VFLFVVTMVDATDAAAAALSKTDGARRSLLVLWPARALFVGPSFALSTHRNAVAVLAVGLDGPLRLARDPRRPQAGVLACRTVLIAPNALHRLDADGDCAFLYIDAASRDLAVLRASCAEQARGLAFRLASEERLLHALRALVDAAEGAEHDAFEAVLAALPLAPSEDVDVRVGEAVRWLLARPARGWTAEELASAFGLSASHFQQRFSAVTGVPVRRMRLWARMRSAVAAALRGTTLTEAALAAGFATPSHFSTAFREMFGMAPSQLMGRRPRLIDLSAEGEAPARGPRSNATPDRYLSGAAQ
jgi:AraC-like DNA-binding protein